MKRRTLNVKVSMVKFAYKGVNCGSRVLYQLCVVLDSLLYPLWLDADVSLRGSGGAML